MVDFLRVREYIAENLVKAGFVERASEWMFGSLYHRLHRLTGFADAMWCQTSIRYEWRLAFAQKICEKVLT
jgi:hypothetical protein